MRSQVDRSRLITSDELQRLVNRPPELVESVIADLIEQGKIIKAVNDHLVYWVTHDYYNELLRTAAPE